MSEEKNERMPEERPAATVIVVTRDNGVVQRYAAPNFGALHDGALVIGDKTEGDDLRFDAMIAPGRWTAVCKDGTELSDDQAKALAIARRALNRIWAGQQNADDPANAEGVLKITDDALSALADLGFE